MNKDNPFISVAEIDEQIAKAQKDTGGPAFPVQGLRDPNVSDGMTLRDYFAAKALQGLASAHKAEDGSWAIWGCEKEAAELSYMIADAMIAERGKA